MSFNNYPTALKEDCILHGRYIIKDVLGQGGFGITYKALDYSTNKTVAIKEYYPSAIVTRTNSLSVMPQSEQNIQDFEYGKEQFLEEAKTLAEFIGNPSVVKVFSFFEEQGTGTAYFVMEYLEGISLSRYLKNKGGRISWQEAWNLLNPIADALSEVHAKNIVHRDIKPDNIIITENQRAKLLDFGAARYVFGVQSQSLETILTPGFAPLEQYYRRGHQGPWTDVYALAATIYCSITGEVPPEAVERAARDTLQSPGALNIIIPDYAEEALLKALSVNYENRFKTTYDFKYAIRNGEILEEKEIQFDESSQNKSTQPEINSKSKSVLPEESGRHESILPGQNDRNEPIHDEKKAPVEGGIITNENKRKQSSKKTLVFFILMILCIAGFAAAIGKNQKDNDNHSAAQSSSDTDQNSPQTDQSISQESTDQQEENINTHDTDQSVFVADPYSEYLDYVNELKSSREQTIDLSDVNTWDGYNLYFHEDIVSISLNSEGDLYLSLTGPSAAKYGENYLIDTEVLKIYTPHIGNGSWGQIIFIKEDGTIDAIIYESLDSESFYLEKNVASAANVENIAEAGGLLYAFDFEGNVTELSSYLEAAKEKKKE